MPICPNMPKYAHMGIWAYGHMRKNMAKWGIPEKSIKNVAQIPHLRSVGPSSQKLEPTTFFAKKMPCILHCNAKKLSNTIST